MKRIFKLVLCIFFIFILIGCESNEEDREKIFSTLKKEKIISESMKQIDIESFSRWYLEGCLTDNYYIYKDNNENMIAIKYEKYIGFDLFITIYYDVIINNDVNIINKEDAKCKSGYKYYKYANGEYTDNNRYVFGKAKEYYAYEKSSLFKGKYYSIELAN